MYVKRISLFIIIGFLSGVATASIIVFTPLSYLVGVALSLLVAIFALVLGKHRSVVFLVSITLLSAALGIWRLQTIRNYTGDPLLEGFIYKKIEVIGIVNGESIDTDVAQRATVRITKVGDYVPPQTTKLLLSTDFYPRLLYGDEVKISGILKKPKVIKKGDGRSFNYPAFLEKDRIYYTMSATDVTRTGKNVGSKIITALLFVKHSFVAKIQSVIPSPESGLLGGYLIEGKQSLSKDLQEEFKIVGVIHTVALSGFNVTIIVKGVMTVLSLLPLWGQLVGGTLSIVLFTLMTGSSTTVLRAAIMALVAIAAQSFGRSYDVTRALLFAAFLMVLWNPMTLVFNSSFQLSFLATLGLVCVSPLLCPYLGWITERYKLRETISSTLSAQLAVLPFILYSTEQLSIVALPANIIMLPFLPVTMLLGTITAALAFIGRLVALPVAAVTYLLLHFQLELVHFFSKIPYAAVTMGIPLWLMLALYAIFGVWLLYNSLRSQTN